MASRSIRKHLLAPQKVVGVPQWLTNARLRDWLYLPLAPQKQEGYRENSLQHDFLRKLDIFASGYH